MKIILCVKGSLGRYLSTCLGANGQGGDIIRPDVSSREVIRVPKGHVWIQGDNLSNSIDSRNYGAVPEATLKGRVLARVIMPLLGYFY